MRESACVCGYVYVCVVCMYVCVWYVCVCVCVCVVWWCVCGVVWWCVCTVASLLSRTASPSLACPVPPYFSTLSRILYWGKKLLNTKCVFRFSLKLRSQTFLILRRTERGIHHKCASVYMSSNCYSCEVLMKPEFYGQIFDEKYSKYQISRNPLQLGLCCSMRTDRHTRSSQQSILSPFRECD
jgi:hypothetical protein